MARGGSTVTEADVLPTTGSQAGLDLVTKLFCDPGDVILAEGPTYVGALGVFGAYEVDVRHVPVDEHGMDPSAVADALDDAAAQVVLADRRRQHDLAVLVRVRRVAHEHAVAERAHAHVGSPPAAAAPAWP